MSYILDALRRAEAERERGMVPGLYARHVASPAPKAVAATPRVVWLAIAAALALVTVAAGLWAWRAANTSASQQAPEAPVAKLATPEPTPTPVPAAVAEPVAQPAAPPVALPAPATSAPVAPTIAKPARAPATSPPASPTTPSLDASASQAPLVELSEDLRRQLPPLTITGAIYSDDPSQRVLVVNNQVVNEGAHVAPEVTLEEIGASSSVFSFRGARFRLAN